MGATQGGNGHAPTYARLLEFRVSFVLPDFRISGKVSVSKMDGKVARIMKSGCSTSRERTETRILLVVSSELPGMFCQERNQVSRNPVSKMEELEMPQWTQRSDHCKKMCISCVSYVWIESWRTQCQNFSGQIRAWAKARCARS